VHSGAASFGHYWSYINTNRGYDAEETGEANWRKTEKDPWMEFNDSSVSDWDFKNLAKECHGNENSTGFFSAGGDTYGTSGYMLFYERFKKKDLKMVVPKDEVDQEKENNVDVKFDEVKDEYYKMVKYRDSAKGAKASRFYKQVYADNNKFDFEKDIYSKEFFEFILSIIQSAITIDDEDAKFNAMMVGKKVAFEVLARCLQNSGIVALATAMTDLLKSSEEL